ncbi:MAG: histidine phosphatase family protein [Kineosporiaceae bacterium]
MTTRRLYLARHGEADAFGTLTGTGRQQSRLLGRRLAAQPVDVVWHSPLPRAVASAAAVAEHLPGVPVIEAPELVDHVPHVPAAAERPPPWAGFFDGWTDAEAAAGRRTAATLVARFGGLRTAAGAATADTHEVVITHSYPIAWLVREALDAPPGRWLGLESANAALTLVEHRNGLPPTLVLFNDMSHLPPDLRWTGFGGGARP